MLREHSLLGYHCTKLTADEIVQIKNHGMSLQNLSSLSERIDKLIEASVIDGDIADRLKNENQANEEYRAEMIWFCFFKPYLAGQGGIERFFRSWGGEALYNSHENDPITGVCLSEIGIPCIIKAVVPISALKHSYFPNTALIRALLYFEGHSINNPFDQEAFSIEGIPAANIVEIIEYPSSAFLELTKCDKWDENL